MTIAAVVTDLDGTIVGAAGISAETVVAAAELHAKGIPLIVATARPPVGVSKLNSIVPYVDLAVCCNGAFGYEPVQRNRLWSDEIDPAVTARIVATLERRLPGAGVGAYDGERWIICSDYVAARGRPPSSPHEVTSRSQVAAVRATALAVRHPAMRSEEITELLVDAGIGSEDAAFNCATPGVVDISPPGVDKASGVLRALTSLQLNPADTVCFGDAPNDLPMFATVGHSIAVANAHPDVLAAADAVCPGVEENGFARALADLGLPLTLR